MDVSQNRMQQGVHEKRTEHFVGLCSAKGQAASWRQMAITSCLTMGPSVLGMCLLHHLANVPECSMQFLGSQIAFATQRQFAVPPNAKTGFCDVKKELRTLSLVREDSPSSKSRIWRFYGARNESVDLVCCVS